jgi:hypothetical protein
VHTGRNSWEMSGSDADDTLTDPGSGDASAPKRVVRRKRRLSGERGNPFGEQGRKQIYAG